MTKAAEMYLLDVLKEEKRQGDVFSKCQEDTNIGGARLQGIGQQLHNS